MSRHRLRKDVLAASLLRSLVLALGLLVCVGATPARAERIDRSLRFVAAGRPDRTIPLDVLRARCGAREVRVDDPYYHREMRFLACPIRAVLELGFEAEAADEAAGDALERSSFLLRALDGYTKPASGEVLLGGGGFVAFADAALTDAEVVPFTPRFEPIDRRQVDPSPFYMVWTGIEAKDAHERPWPYQLATIEITSLERAFGRAAPRGLERSDRAWRGFERFVAECIACHSVNGEGGRVGPELNVPRSIVEYREAKQLKAFIQNPQSFRYTSMPAHLHLGEGDLDDLLAYFRAMSERKDDPAKPGSTGGAAHE